MLTRYRVSTLVREHELLVVVVQGRLGIDYPLGRSHFGVREFLHCTFLLSRLTIQ